MEIEIINRDENEKFKILSKSDHCHPSQSDTNNHTSEECCFTVGVHYSNKLIGCICFTQSCCGFVIFWFFLFLPLKDRKRTLTGG